MKKKINPQAMQIADYLHDWLEHYVPSIKACSPHTKRNYKISVKLYVEFLRVIKGTTPETLSAECFCMEYIMEWIIWLKENRGCSPATCNVRLSALRVFLKYLSFRDISYMSVFLQAENVPNEKNSKRKVIGLSKQAVDVLLSMPNQGSTIGFRDYTLMLLLYSTAVRINELLTLKISNIVIDCVKPHIIVIGKGRKKRPIPLLAKPAQCLKRYLIKYHPKQNDANALLFCSKSKGIYVPMSAENVNKMLKKYATMAHERCQDVPMDLHAHQFRHAKASHWLENGMNIA
ncbi:tyrosine-type recombinase/integrase, partial [Parabacteroides distasonis]